MFRNVIAWFRRKRDERQAALVSEEQVVVRVDDAGVQVSFPGGEEHIAWPEVRCVAIETNDSGPWGADLWWLIEGESKRCVYPGGATGGQEALTELAKRLQGFDHGAVIEAMGSTSNARFVCWQRSDGS